MKQPTRDRKIRYAVIGCAHISQQAFIPGIERAENSVLPPMEEPHESELIGLSRAVS